MPAPGTLAHGMKSAAAAPKIKAAAPRTSAYPRTITFSGNKRAAKRSPRKMK